MSAKYTFLAWDTPIENAPLKLTLLQLANNSNDGGVSWYSIPKMATACGMSERTFMRKIGELEQMGILEVMRRPNRTSVYKLIAQSMGDSLSGGDSLSRHSDTLSPRGDSLSHDPNKSPVTVPEINVPPSVVPSKKSEYPAQFEELWGIKPNREGGNPKNKAYSACKARLKSGSTWEEMKEGLIRYKSFCEKKGLINTSMVQMMSTFFGTGEGFKESWGVAVDPAKIEKPQQTPEQLAELKLKQQQEAEAQMRRDLGIE